MLASLWSDCRPARDCDHRVGRRRVAIIAYGHRVHPVAGYGWVPMLAMEWTRSTISASRRGLGSHGHGAVKIRGGLGLEAAEQTLEVVVFQASVSAREWLRSLGSDSPDPHTQSSCRRG